MEFREQAKILVAKMTPEEKAGLLSGKNFWYTKSVPRLGLSAVMMTDGPHGLRKQETAADQLGLHQSLPAVCFPTASALACSFDRPLLYAVGQAIGEECRQENVAVLLGPGINIKRSPLCGRNFEYFSEDPLVSGELAAAFINGLQSQNVGASLKHFAVNNQEKRRMTVDAVVDQRALREIYLAGFERVVRKARPWTVMCSYNRLDGLHASQNRRLLTGILREEWGFEGLVVSDWGATVERVKALQAGLDLEMPGLNGTNGSLVLDALKRGEISQETLDAAAERVVELILRSKERQPYRYSAVEHHALARRAAAQSAVLLKNDGQILPGNLSQKAAVIGAFARYPRYQGSGSSRIAPVQVDNALDVLRGLGLDAAYAPGYRLDSDEPDEALIAEACRAATGRDIVYLFAGLLESDEAETFDRESMVMPESHVRLIEAVSQVNKHVVVILHCGAPVEMTWAERVPGILLMYLGGEAGGGACADLLLGMENPGGKLAESWPFTAADAPSHAYFPGYPLTVEYREGLFVGYRYYDTARKAVRYPFGYGLSYTRFAYSDLHLSTANMRDTEELAVTCRVTNTGSRTGSEVVQLYIAANTTVIIRAAQDLRGFEKVRLEPGESREVTFTLTGRDFAYYNTHIGGWHVESGGYEIRIGASSRDIRLAGEVCVQSSVQAPLPDLRSAAPEYYDLSQGISISDPSFRAVLGRDIPPRERKKGAPHTMYSTLPEIQDRFLGRLIWMILNHQKERELADKPELQVMAEKTIMDMPLFFLPMATSGGISIIQVQGLVELLNAHWLNGLRLTLRKSHRSNHH